MLIQYFPCQYTKLTGKLFHGFHFSMLYRIIIYHLTIVKIASCWQCIIRLYLYLFIFSQHNRHQAHKIPSQMRGEFLKLLCLPLTVSVTKLKKNCWLPPLKCSCNAEGDVKKWYFVSQGSASFIPIRCTFGPSRWSVLC